MKKRCFLWYFLWLRGLFSNISKIVYTGTIVSFIFFVSLTDYIKHIYRFITQIVTKTTYFNKLLFFYVFWETWVKFDPPFLISSVVFDPVCLNNHQILCKILLCGAGTLHKRRYMQIWASNKQKRLSYDFWRLKWAK